MFERRELVEKIDSAGGVMELLGQISESLQTGSTEKVATLIKQAIEQNVGPGDVLDKGLIAGMSVIGEKYKRHEIFLPEVLLAAKAMHAGMDILKPLFLKDDMPTRGSVVIGTVQGDIHDIGKNLVGIMLRGAGFRVIDLGKDVPPEKFVAAAKKENAEVIGMSALLTTTMPIMKNVVELVKNEGLNGRVKTIIGGAPVSAEYAQHIGADAYGYDSMNAVECIRELVQKP